MANGFDIDTLIEYRPPRYRCEKCCAINLPERVREKGKPITCPVCHVTYLPTEQYNEVVDYLTIPGMIGREINDPIGHGRLLASIVRGLRDGGSTPPMALLFQLIRYARQFIHFTSHGISHQLIGALKATTWARVRGIVTGADDSVVRELTEYPNEAWRFTCRVFGDEHSIPHQRLFIVDGFVAIVGSVDLTLASWRDLDNVRVVTDLDEVARLNNEYFAPSWGASSTIGDTIEMSSEEALLRAVFGPFT